MIMLIVKRLAAGVVIVLFLTAVMFTLQKVTPVDPVHAMLGAQTSGSQVLAERHRLGLDRPVVAQYLSYLAGLPKGDFGMSYRTRRPVSTDLGSFVPATAELTVYALLFALILAALQRHGAVLPDRADLRLGATRQDGQGCPGHPARRRVAGRRSALHVGAHQLRSERRPQLPALLDPADLQPAHAGSDDRQRADLLTNRRALGGHRLLG